MTMALFMEGSQQRIAEDTELTNWATSHFGKSFTLLETVRQVAQINSKEYPVAMFRTRDGATSGESIGGQTLQEAEIVVEVAWIEKDRERALQQYKELIDLMIKAFMRDHCLKGTIGGAWVTQWQTGDPGLYPVNIIAFLISGEYKLSI